MHSVIVHAKTFSDEECAFEGLSSENAEHLVHALALTGTYCRVWTTAAMSLGDNRPEGLRVLGGC